MQGLVSVCTYCVSGLGEKKFYVNIKYIFYKSSINITLLFNLSYKWTLDKWNKT